MLARVRSRLTFANVTSVIALVAALGLGTAWALERNSVESRHIVNGEVRGVDVASGQVQLRVGNSCPAGQAIRVIGADGTVACEVDDSGSGGTTYTAGDGLALNGNTFSIHDCPANDILRWTTQSGWACSQDRALGNAGGDLTGTYPDPDIAQGKVGSNEVADGTIAAADLASGVQQGKRLDARLTGSDPPASLINQNGFVLTADCTLDALDVYADLAATGPNGSTLNWTTTQDDRTVEGAGAIVRQQGKNLSATPQNFEGASSYDNGGFFGVRQHNAIFRSSSATISYDLNVVASTGENGVCLFNGTAVVTP